MIAQEFGFGMMKAALFRVSSQSVKSPKLVVLSLRHGFGFLTTAFEFRFDVSGIVNVTPEIGWQSGIIKFLVPNFCMHAENSADLSMMVSEWRRQQL